MDSPSCGMMMGILGTATTDRGLLHKSSQVDASQSTSKQFPHGCADCSSRGSMGAPEVWVKRYRRILRVEPHRRRIEKSKAFAGDPGNDLRRHAAPGPRLAHREQPAGSRYRREDGIGIERLDRAQV